VGLVVVAAVAVVAVRGGDDGEPCVSDLARRMPADVTLLTGSDLRRARDAGYDDDTFEAMSGSAVELDVIPDPVTMEGVQRGGQGDGPFDPADVGCWVGDFDTFVARGEFDEERVAAAGDDALRVDGDLLADAPDGVPASGDAPAPLLAAVDALEDEGAVSFRLSAGPGDDTPAWAGTGLARGSGWDLVVVWAYADDTAAADGEESIRAALDDDSSIPEMVTGDAAGALARDGTTVRLRAPLRDAPNTWGRRPSGVRGQGGRGQMPEQLLVAGVPRKRASSQLAAFCPAGASWLRWTRNGRNVGRSLNWTCAPRAHQSRASWRPWAAWGSTSSSAACSITTGTVGRIVPTRFSATIERYGSAAR
jgi:hypothetical protein